MDNYMEMTNGIVDLMETLDEGITAIEKAIDKVKDELPENKVG